MISVGSNKRTLYPQKGRQGKRTATKPDKHPFMAAIKSNEASPVVAFPMMTLYIKALIQAAEEAKKVLTAHRAAISDRSGLSDNNNAEPGLKPNPNKQNTINELVREHVENYRRTLNRGILSIVNLHPNHKMKLPSIWSDTEWPGMGFGSSRGSPV